MTLHLLCEHALKTLPDSLSERTALLEAVGRTLAEDHPLRGKVLEAVNYHTLAARQAEMLREEFVKLGGRQP